MSHRLAVCGEFQVGKSSFVERFVKGTWSPAASEPQRWHDELHSTSFMIDGKEKELTILDTGRVFFGGRMDTSEYEIPKKFLDANAVLICVDIGRKRSLEDSTRTYMRMAARYAKPHEVPLYVVGLKADERSGLFSIGTISREAGETLANTWGCAGYFECSAKTGEGVRDVFESIVRDLDATAVLRDDGKAPRVKKDKGLGSPSALLGSNPLFVDTKKESSCTIL